MILVLDRRYLPVAMTAILKSIKGDCGPPPPCEGLFIGLLLGLRLRPLWLRSGDENRTSRLVVDDGAWVVGGG